MNLNDLSIIYTEKLEEIEKKNVEKAKIFFKRKIMPRVIKAIHNGKDRCIIYTFTKKSKFLTEISLLIQSELPWNKYNEYELENDTTRPPFANCRYQIWGWKKINPEPDEILKKNL